ncbi:Putative peptidyl-tRNA hydrolase PTRHD1 [Linum perenne]
MATQLLLFSPCRLTTSYSSLPRLFLPSTSKIRATLLPLHLRSLRSNSMSSGASELDSNPEKNESSSGEEDVVVQYVVLRRDLIDTWPMGSVVTQGCHAAVAAIWSNKDDDHTIRYCGPEKIDSMHKVLFSSSAVSFASFVWDEKVRLEGGFDLDIVQVTLEVKGETQMLNLAEKLRNGGIVHKVWIEQPENIPTSIATKPYPKSQVASFFKKLKLCK